MDPVGAAASIIAIIQISGSVISLCYQYIGSVKDAHEDITKVLSEVASLKVILEEVKVLADKAISSGQPQLAAIFDMLNSTDGPLASCQAALGLIRDKLGQGLETTSRKKLLWPLKERSVEKVLAFIQRQKGTLLLCLCADIAQVTVQLEQALKENSVSISQIQESLNGNLEATLRVEDALELSQAREYQQRVIKWLRPPDSSSNHNSACELQDPDTGGWLLASNEWSQWLGSPGNVFWLHGMPGCGKTILCSTAIERLRQQPDSSSSSSSPTVLYFYFDFSDAEKQAVEGLLRSLLSQVVSKTVNIPEAIKKLFDEYGGNRQPTLAMLKTLLMEILKDGHKIIVVLDALDECSERGPLLRLLSDMHEQCSKSINLLLTSRKERGLEVVLGKLATQNMPMQQSAVDGDIKTFLQNQLSSDSKLKFWPGKVKSEIAETLGAKSDGMFRWVVCQLDVLRNCYDYPSVKNRLRKLPDTLDATYERILLSIPPHYQHLAHNVLQWLSFSLRPVTLGEIADAAVVNRKEKTFNIEDRLFDVTNVLDICSSLVILAETGLDNIARPRKAKRESEKELRLAHYSVKEFLLSNRIQSGPAKAFIVTEIEAHECLGEICLIYLLSFDKPGSLYKDVWEEFPLLDYAASRWYKHCRILPASKSNILDLSLCLLDAKKECYSNWLRICDPEHGNRHMLSCKAGSFAAPLYYAVKISYPELIKQLLSHGADIDVKGGFLGFPLQAAVMQNDGSIAELLLEHGADIHMTGGLYGHTLPATILFNHVSIAKMIIERGVSPDADGERRRYVPLHLAAYYGHQDMVQLLIDKGADVNIHGTVYGTALLAAIESQNSSTSSTETIVKLLIDAGAEVNSRAGMYDHPRGQGTPLAAAAYRGDENIVRLLLKYGASPLVQGSWGSPREIAALGGHEHIAQLLVDNGALSAEHQNQWDANLKALFSGNERSLNHRGHILKFLLANGASPRVLDESEREEGRALFDSVTGDPSPTEINGIISYLVRMETREDKDEDEDGVRLEAAEPSARDCD